uniref:sulfurtransferase n=1 Tax=Ningiella ruwaisensis TaxID=2364274 RepID=UPI00109FC70E|nr:rhodanese-like domain-containing protein [Ningiella ruwaisensis]
MIESEISCKDLAERLSIDYKTILDATFDARPNTKNTASDEIQSNSNLVVLYTSMRNAPASKPEIVSANPDKYIPRSIFIDFQHNVVDKTSSLSNTMPPAHDFEREVERLGISNESHIVVYDDFGNFCASRVWFMFKSMGHDKIQVLRGGLAAWLHADLPTDTQLLTSACVNSGTTQTSYIASPSTNFRFVDRDYILRQIVESDSEDNDAQVLLDARSQTRFDGEQNESKPNLRAGHIPNSLNLHYARLQDKNGKFKDKNALRKEFDNVMNECAMKERVMNERAIKEQAMQEQAKRNKDANPHLIFTCGSGVTACILAQAADALGYSPLFVYDGSWSEWGMQTHLPITTKKDTADGD